MWQKEIIWTRKLDAEEKGISIRRVYMLVALEVKLLISFRSERDLGAVTNAFLESLEAQKPYDEEKYHKTICFCSRHNRRNWDFQWGWALGR